eukprot:7380690-Prymnesium_polylepis.1
MPSITLATVAKLAWSLGSYLMTTQALPVLITPLAIGIESTRWLCTRRRGAVGGTRRMAEIDTAAHSRERCARSRVRTRQGPRALRAAAHVWAADAPVLALVGAPHAGLVARDVVLDQHELEARPQRQRQQPHHRARLERCRVAEPLKAQHRQRVDRRRAARVGHHRRLDQIVSLDVLEALFRVRARLELGDADARA